MTAPWCIWVAATRCCVIVLVAVPATLVIEAWNMELLTRLLARDGTRGFRIHRITQWSLRWYRKAPFWSLVATCVLPIVPHYPMRFLAVLAGLPHLEVPALGDARPGHPLLGLAGIGPGLPVPGPWIVVASLVVLALGIRGARRMNQLRADDASPAVAADRRGSMSRCFLLLVDGLRPDVAEARLAAGDLPHLASMLRRGGRTTAITGFPSTTSVAYLPFLTGCAPGRCDIPSIRWLDRAPYGGRWWRDRAEVRSYCGYQAPHARRRHRPDVRTIFELVPESVGIFTPVARGLTPERDPVPAGAAALGLGGPLRQVAPALRRCRLPPPAPGRRPGLALRVRPVPGGGRLHPSDRATIPPRCTARLPRWTTTVGRLRDLLRRAGRAGARA